MFGDEMGFEVNGIRCYALGNNTFCCAPGTPTPELDPSGRPTLSLWMIPPKARLQLGAHWALTPAETESVRAELAHRSHAASAEIQLSSAPLQVETAALVLVDQDRVGHDLATSASSGFLPFSALFTVALEEAAAALVASAINGGRGRLFVEYRARVEVSTPIKVSAAGDITAEVIASRTPLSPEDAASIVRNALSAKHLTVTRTGPEEVPNEVWSPLQDQLLAAVAEDVQRLTGTNSPTTPTQVSIARVVTGDYRVTDTLTRRADVADWFADGSGPSHIRALDMPSAGTR